MKFTAKRGYTEREIHGRLERLTLALSILQIVCGIGFAIDLAQEFPDPRNWTHLSFEAAVHLGSELVIMGLLFTAFAVARYAQRLLRLQRDVKAQHLDALRGDFDVILQARFDAWGLTLAQRDVALLCLRGLRNSEIAQMRGTAEGTIKAHLSAVFRAAGVTTRNELLGLFMEAFLDHGTQQVVVVRADATTPDRANVQPA